MRGMAICGIAGCGMAICGGLGMWTFSPACAAASAASKIASVRAVVMTADRNPNLCIDASRVRRVASNQVVAQDSMINPELRATQHPINVPPAKRRRNKTLTDSDFLVDA
jgi:hypothetical protein